MRRGRRVDRNRPDLDTIRPIGLERAVGPDDRSGEPAVSTPDREIALGIGHRKAGPLAGPSTRRESRFPWAGRTAAAGEEAAARGERSDPHTCATSLHTSL